MAAIGSSQFSQFLVNVLNRKLAATGGVFLGQDPKKLTLVVKLISAEGSSISQDCPGVWQLP